MKKSKELNELKELVAQPLPPTELSENPTEPDGPHVSSPTQAWLRRVAFLIAAAAAAPAAGCDNSGISSGDVCAAYAAKLVHCNSYYAGYREYIEEYCNSYLEYASTYGELCRAAYEDYFACISHVSCAELEGETEEFSCEEEAMQLEQDCDYGYDDGSGSGSSSGSGSDSDPDF